MNHAHGPPRHSPDTTERDGSLALLLCGLYGRWRFGTIASVEGRCTARRAGSFRPAQRLLHGLWLLACGRISWRCIVAAAAGVGVRVV